jgi:tRNA (guanine26-N2/guanine27-N2)-dimethyltransferase
MLMLISEELHDQPLYYEPDQLMRVIKCSMPKMAIFRSALLNAGFRCSGSHCNPKALKTNAPVQFIWDVCRAWVRKMEKRLRTNIHRKFTEKDQKKEFTA